MDGKHSGHVVLAEDTAEQDEHRVDHAASLDPSQLGTAQYEADCMYQCRNLVVLPSDATLSDALDL